MPSTRRPVSQRPAGRVAVGSTRARTPGARPAGLSRPTVEPHGATAVAGAASRAPLTGRAAVLVVVVVVLGLSFAYPLRGWFDQRAQIAELNERTVAQERKIVDLRAALERWDDPAYVQAVARERLRFVMPGEASFVVLGGTAPAGGGELTGSDPDGEWWQRLWATVEEADRPLAPPGDAPGSDPAVRPTAGGPASSGPSDGSPDSPTETSSPAPVDAG